MERQKVRKVTTLLKVIDKFNIIPKGDTKGKRREKPSNVIGAEELEQTCVTLDVKLCALPQYKPHLCLHSSVKCVILTHRKKICVSVCL